MQIYIDLLDYVVVLITFIEIKDFIFLFDAKHLYKNKVFNNIFNNLNIIIYKFIQSSVFKKKMKYYISVSLSLCLKINTNLSIVENLYYMI